MKNIAEILSSLFQPATGTNGSPKGNPIALPNGLGAEVGTFEDVLAQLASQQQGGEEGASPTVSAVPPSAEDSADLSLISQTTPSREELFESFASLSVLDLQITETVRVDNLAQLEQAEKALVSLAAGLSNLLHLVSSLQSMDSKQAQQALASIGAGPITLDDAKTLLEDLRAITANASDAQNPLLLTPEDQNSFLNQMLQQMIQSQQLLFGTLSNSGTNPSFPGLGAGTEVVLQMSFSDLSFTQINRTGDKTTAVFIDIETFQMSATFIQTGLTQTRGENLLPASNPSFRSLFSADMDSMSRSLDRLLSNQTQTFGPVSASGQTPPSVVAVSMDSQEILFQNFKGLVQLLIQNGVTQAALTTIMNRQRDDSKSDLREYLARNASGASADPSVGSLNDPLEVPPVSAVNSAALTIDHSRALNASLPRQEEIFSGQADHSRALNPSLPGRGGIFSGIATPEEGKGIVPVVSENLVALTDLSSDPHEPLSLIVDRSTPSGQTLDLRTLNDIVARLNALSPQYQNVSVGSGDPPPDVTVDQLISSLKNISPVPVQVADDSSPLGISHSSRPLPSMNIIDVTSMASVRTVETAIMLRQGTEPVAFISTVDSMSFSHERLIQMALPAGESLSFAQTKSLDIVPVAPQKLVDVFLSAGTLPQALPSTNGIDISAPVQPVQPILIQPILLPGKEPLNITYSINVLSGSAIADSHISLNTNTPFTAGLSIPSSLQVSDIETNLPKPALQQPLVPVVRVSIQQSFLPDTTAIRVNVTVQMPLPAQQDIPVAGMGAPNVVISTAQNISLSLMAGGVIKNPYLTQTVADDTRNQQVLSAPAQLLSEVKPILPQGVVPINQSVAVAPLFVRDSQTKDVDNPIGGQVNGGVVMNVPSLVAPAINSVVLTSPQTSQSALADSANILNQFATHVTARAAEIKALSHLSFQLIPESLGRVTVQIALVDHAISARIVVNNPEVKEAMQGHLVELKTALNQAGLQIDQMQVHVQGGSSNLLAQYYQYQQEGFGYRLPSSAALAAPEEVNSLENTGVFENMSLRTSLLDVLA